MTPIGQTKDGRTLFEHNGIVGTYFDFDVNLKSPNDPVVGIRIVPQWVVDGVCGVGDATALRLLRRGWADAQPHRG